MSELVTVSGIAAGGDGVGRLADGRAVFLPRTATGDRVRLNAERLRVHRHFARGEADEIVEPAPQRVAPVCPHFVHDRCGGASSSICRMKRSSRRSGPSWERASGASGNWR